MELDIHFRMGRCLRPAGIELSVASALTTRLLASIFDKHMVISIYQSIRFLMSSCVVSGAPSPHILRSSYQRICYHTSRHRVLVTTDFCYRMLETDLKDRPLLTSPPCCEENSNPHSPPTHTQTPHSCVLL